MDGGMEDMGMKDEDRKILTEFLGEEWNTIDSVRNEIGDLGVLIYYGTKPELNNRTFDTWEDFGMLWEKVESKDLFISWLYMCYFGDIDKIMSWNRWEKKLPEDRCLIILRAIKDGVLK